MKRTRAIDLNSLRKADKSFVLKPAAVGVMAATLSACGDSEVANIYPNVMECAMDNPEFVELCQMAYEEALEEAAETSPKYIREDDCEADFGLNSCDTYSNYGGTWFMPAMAGFLFAQVIDDIDFDLKKKKKKRYYSPLFLPKNRKSPVFGNWVSATGKSYGAFNTKKVKVSSKAFAPKPRVTQTTKRGGFGNMARKVASRSGWGG